MADQNDLIVSKVLPQLFVTLLISLLGTLVGVYFIPAGLAALCGLVTLVILIAVLIYRAVKGKSSNYGVKIPMGFVYFISFLMGITMYPALKFYVSGMGASWVVACFVATVVMFASLAAYAYFSKKDFSGIGAFLFFALVAIVVVGIANLFIGSGIVQVLLAWVGLLVFSGYMLYDISRMKKRDFTEEDVPAAVLDLYLNFINILLDILRIVYGFNKN